MTGAGRTLYIIVCGAGPASDVENLIALAHADGWDVQVIATLAALDFVDAEALEDLTGHPVRSRYRRTDQPRSPRANAIIVAPATYNTINKWAAGISDTYALGILAEAPSLGIPIVVLPFVNTALAARAAFQSSVTQLSAEGVRILLGPGEFEAHPPGTGGSRLDTYPWHLALSEVTRLVKDARADP